ncbi:MAG: class I SAM-dependent methyltransferase [Flavobacterium sp.]|nr:MAG: class I SAM-dependent methyltransferase [Flavobacterium sp.]
MLPRLLDALNKNSLNQKFRRKRFILMKQLIDRFEKPVSILDIGGTYNYWQNMDFNAGNGVKITLLNLKKEEVNHPNFESVVGDATDLKEYNNNSFDIVFSNSVIEHLYTFENQIKMAKEVCRVGKTYYIQTPNKWFPIEPHWLVPFFQFLPFKMKVHLTKNFNLGTYRKLSSIEAARRCVLEVRLMTEKEMKQIFEEAHIWKEKFFLFTKSIVAIKGL